MTDVRHPTTPEQDNWAAVRRQFWGNDKRGASPAAEQPAVIAGVDPASGPGRTVVTVYDRGQIIDQFHPDCVYDVARHRFVGFKRGFWTCGACKGVHFWTYAQHLEHQAGCDGH